MKLKKLTASCAMVLLMLGTSSVSSARYYKPVYDQDSTKSVVKDELKGLEGNVNNEIAKLESSVVAEIDRVEDRYTSYINDSTQKIIEAIRVATSQEAFSSMQMSRADKDAKQVMVNAMIADAQSEAALEAMIKYSPTMGQGYSACKVYSENGQLAQTMDSVKKQTSNKVTEGDNSPLSISPSVDAAYHARTAVHNANFCTDAEGERNICEPVEEHMQGADSNSATLFVSAPRGSDVALAKQTVRQNILGSPTVAIPRNVATTAGGQAYLYSTNHKTALAAFPAYSLAYLESMSEIREDVKDADGNPMSPNDMLFNTVARYYGGAESAEWQKSMIAQQPRGLLVELAKMEGLGAWMDYQEYLAMQRMEGNMAAMTLTAAIPIEQKLDKQRARTKSKSIKTNLIDK